MNEGATKRGLDSEDAVTVGMLRLLHERQTQGTEKKKIQSIKMKGEKTKEVNSVQMIPKEHTGSLRPNAAERHRFPGKGLKELSFPGPYLGHCTVEICLGTGSLS